ncbi:MAG: hypothetical protein ACYDCL_18700 [Myxococcales bacterium]
MLKLVPKLRNLLSSSDQERTRLMLKSLGAIDAELQALPARGLVVIVGDEADRPCRLLARQLVDLAVRLEPLVGCVYVDSPHPREVIADLPQRFPLDVAEETSAPDARVSILVGESGANADLHVDAAGWSISLGKASQATRDTNPVGPLAGAAIACGEAFKVFFKLAFPDRPLSKQAVPMNGDFSFWDYTASATSPGLEGPVELDALLVGVGGVGSGAVMVFAEMSRFLRGKLTLIDDDVLDGTNVSVRRPAC